MSIIEYDGIQHFETLNFNKPQEMLNNALKEIKERDKIKTDYCEKQHIKLLRIAYTDYDNIENILTNLLTK